jgi:lysophospholipase L1-like esterase
MIFHLATIVLGPVFYLQGRYVKRVTPKLPEPVGDRAGQVGDGPHMSLLIVGDSAAAGVGVAHQEQGLSGHLLDSLRGRHSVTWKLIANSGDRSDQLLERLKCAPVERFGMVVVSIGVNDVTALTSTAQWVKNLDAIVDTLRSKFGAEQIFFSSVPPMHYFPALPHPLRWWLGLRARHLNSYMQQVTERNVGCEFVWVPYMLDHKYVAADGFHPGRLAYEVWGACIAELILLASNDSKS